MSHIPEGLQNIVTDIADMVCPHCQDTGWVCEAHPDKVFECECRAAGMRCRCKSYAQQFAPRQAYDIDLTSAEYQRLNFGPELT